MSLLVRTDVVVGEASINHFQEVNFKLPQRGQRVKEKRGKLVEVETRLVEERVLLEGVFQGEIFYVGEDNRIHHHRQGFPFQVLCHLPGAEEHMEAWAQPRVEELLLQPPEGTDQVMGKVFLGGHVVVTRRETLSLAPGTDHLLLLPEVVAIREEKLLLEHQLFPVPPPVELGEIKAQISALSGTALTGRVLVQGDLVEELYYVGPGGQEYLWREQFSFEASVSMVEVEPEDRVEVRGSLKGILPEVERKEENGVAVRIVVELEVVATRPIQAEIKRGETLIRAPLVLGENTRERLLTDFWELEHGAKTVRCIRPRVLDLRGQPVGNQILFEGVLHKELTYVGDDRKEYNQDKRVPFTDCIPLEGGTSGSMVHTWGRAAPAGWKLGERGLEDRLVLELHGTLLRHTLVPVEVEKKSKDDDLGGLGG